MNEQIVKEMRSISKTCNALEIAELLDSLLTENLQQSNLIFYFKAAFPEIPLRALIKSSAWERVGGGGLSDLKFIEALADWFPRK